MHSAALQLTPVLGAEKSRVPFFIAAGILVVWAMAVFATGMRRPDFPGSLAGQRAIGVVSVLLVLATVSMAVLTASTPARAPTRATTTAPPAAAAPSGAGTPTTAPPAGGATTSLSLAADPSGALKYDAKQLSAKAGTVSITMANMSPLEHNVTIEQGGAVLGATPTFKGGSRTLRLSLKPGTYKFYCSVPGHRAAGMEGTLTVS